MVPARYGPGAGLLLVFLTGILMHARLVRKLNSWAERLLYRIPLIRSVYGFIRDLFNLHSHDQEQAPNQTVVISYTDMRLIGFVIYPGHCRLISMWLQEFSYAGPQR
jgi:uncharacterized membrane protein